MKILVLVDNVDILLEVYRLYMIVIVGVEIVLKIYFLEVYFFLLNNRYFILLIDKFYCYFIFFIYQE